MPGAELAGPGGDSDPPPVHLGPHTGHTQPLGSRRVCVSVCVCVPTCASCLVGPVPVRLQGTLLSCAVPSNVTFFLLAHYVFISSLKLYDKRTDFPVFSLRF